MHIDISPTQSVPQPLARDNTLTVVLSYAGFASLWILLSDKILQVALGDPGQIVLASMLKGWLFVAVSSLLLYALLKRRVPGAVTQRPRFRGNDSGLPAALLTIGIVVLATAGITHSVLDTQDKEIARLQTIADLKAQQISDWLVERQQNAELFRMSGAFQRRFGMWHSDDETAGSEALRELGEHFVHAGTFYAVTLFNSDGQPLWGTAESPHEPAPALLAVMERASRERSLHRVGPYLGLNGKIRLDFIILLDNGLEPPLNVVLHADPEDWLYSTLQSWPVPSTSGETLLFRREGGHILFLNELRHSPNSAVRRLRIPLTRGDLLAAQAASGATGPNRVLYGNDYRGVPVVGVARAIPDTDWFLIAKVNRDELYHDAVKAAAWIAVAAALALFIFGVGVAMLRQRQQLAIAESARQLQEIADCSDDAIFAKDLQGRYTLVNRAASRITGKAAGEVLGHDDRMLFPAEQAEMLQAHDLGVLSAGHNQCLEEELDTSSGRRMFLSTKGPLHDASGRLIGLFGVSRDITERKQAERELRESEERFRAVVEQSLAGIYIIQDQRIRYVNPRFAEIFGYDSPQVIVDQVQIVELVCPEDRNVVMENIRRRFEGTGGDLKYSFSGLHRDGRRIEFGVQGRIATYDGRLATIGFCVDVTARKQVEDRLRKLAQAVEQSPESIVITDPNCTIEYVNKAFTRATGYTQDEVIGQNPRILHSGKTPSQTFEALWYALTQGKSWKGEFINRRKDGSEYVEFAIISPLYGPDGRNTHYVAVKEDITEKKHLATELDRHRHHLEELVASRTAELEKARVAADAASQAKSAFLANMSHEIRTPMNAIIGLTYLLRRDNLSPEQNERLHKISTAAAHLLSVINDILDLSKIEAGRMELEHSDFSMEAVLDHIQSLVAEQARAKGLTIEVDGGDVPRQLHGDLTRLRQAMLNFAGNAIKFTERGTIWLRAKLLEDADEGLLVRFEVQDTGIGIAEDKLFTLFEAFTQADVSTTRKYGGTAGASHHPPPGTPDGRRCRRR
jgi:PAS domain S-box-containing protein